MEKISLKPIAHELLFKTDEPNAQFDVVSYQGSSNQEKALGSLFIVSNVSYEGEDLGYVINLLSSLARREYYSEVAVRGQDPRKAFEGTLHKLNDVLKDFFASKTFSLNVGLAAISGGKIFISRLGKFKVGLARNGEYIDVLNNVALFHRSTENEQQFSNIISGTLFPGDNIFAYYPARCLTSRERAIQASLLRDTASDFGSKLSLIAQTANNFNCCGVHINIEEIKEIPVESLPRYSAKKATPPTPTKGLDKSMINELNTSATLAATPASSEPIFITREKETQADDSIETEPERKLSDPKVIAAELSLTRRNGVFSTTRRAIGILASFGSLTSNARIRYFMIAAAVIVVPLLTFAIIRSTGNDDVKAALRTVTGNMKQAQSKIAENDTRGARAILQDSLAQLSSFNNKQINVVKNQIAVTLNEVDHTNASVRPALIHEFAALLEGTQLTGLVFLDTSAVGITSAGELLQASGTIGTKLASVRLPVAFAFGGSYIAAYDNVKSLSVYSQKTKQVAVNTLKNAEPASLAAMYEDSLYVLSGSHVYKFTDAALGGSPRILWNKDVLPDNALSLAIDGNIYFLTKDGKLLTYFKGKKKAEFDLSLNPSEKAQLLTTKDGRYLYLVDPVARKVFSFEKENGSLSVSYPLDTVGTIAAGMLTGDGTLFILSGDNKVWQLKL